MSKLVLEKTETPEGVAYAFHDGDKYIFIEMMNGEVWLGMYEGEEQDPVVYECHC